MNHEPTPLPEAHTHQPTPPADVHTHQPTPLAEVHTHQSGPDTWTLIFVRHLNHPPTKVWTALTSPTHLSQWAPFTASRDLSTTGDATLSMLDGESHQDTQATVTHADPPKLLEYTWGKDLLRWELEPTPISTNTDTPTGTRLTLLHTAQNQHSIPKLAAGWHLCLDVAEQLLSGTPTTPIRGKDALNHGWSSLHAQYSSKLAIPTTPIPPHPHR